MMIEPARFPSLKAIVASPPDNWSESDVPLAKRGVSLSWLIETVRGVLEDINRARIEAIAQRENAINHNRAGFYNRHDRPDLPVPDVPRVALMNVRSLVEHVVLPLTAASRTPLWTHVPDAHRGEPDYFLSHTWNSLLLGPPRQPVGTLDAVEHLGRYVWIDFVAYNQHRIESIPTDMEHVIGEIGKVIFAGTPVPTLGRIWCLWELLCANRTGTDFDVGVRRGYRNDKILAVNTLYRSFVGVEKATATKAEDLNTMSNEVRKQFGSVEHANAYLEHVLQERFSDSSYELRERDQHLGFRPWPLIYEQGPGGEQLSRKAVREADPYYGPGIRESVVYGSGQDTFDLLIESGAVVSYDESVDHQLRTSTTLDLKLLEAIEHGDVPSVQNLVAAGADIDRPFANMSSLALAARRGHASLVSRLLGWGADMEGGEGVSPLAAAAWSGEDGIVRLLLERGANIEGDTGGPGTALFQASSEGHLSTVLLLLDVGAAVNATTEKRATPLLVASASGHLEIVTCLVATRANLDCTDRSGDTALHHAAHKGFGEVVRTLIAAGADRTIVDKYGDTAFDIGARNTGLDRATCELLRS